MRRSHRKPPPMAALTLLAAAGIATVATIPGQAFAIPPSVIDTIAGGGIGDGRPGLQTHLTAALSVAADAAGNVFWTESNHLLDASRARMWSAETDLVRTIAGHGLQKTSDQRNGDGGPATLAMLWNAGGITVDAVGTVYLHDTGNSRIRRIDPSTGLIGTAATAGTGSTVEVDNQNRVLFASGSQIRRYDPSTGNVQTIAGGGSIDLDEQPATSVSISTPQDIEVDAVGNIYFSESTRIRWIDTQGVIHTLAGGRTGAVTSDGQYGLLTQLQGNYHPILLRGDGSLWFVDNTRVRRIDPVQELASLPGSRRVTTVFTVAGGYADGPLADGYAGSITKWDAYPGGGIVIADSTNRRIRLIDGGEVRTIAGDGLSGTFEPGEDVEPDMYDWTGDGLPARDGFLHWPCAVATAPNDDIVVGEGSSGFHYRVRRVDVSSSLISTVAGTATKGSSGDGGPATSARLTSPCGVLVAPDGDVHIADGPAHVVRKVEADTGVITTVAGTGEDGYGGDGGPGSQAKLRSPASLAMDTAGNLYVSDPGDHRIRKVRTDGVIVTVAGNGTQGFFGDGGGAKFAHLNGPRGLAFLGDGSLVFADSGNHRVRKVEPAGTISTIAGAGYAGLNEGPWLEAEFNTPTGLAVDRASGTIFVVDALNHLVRRLDPDGFVRILAGNTEGEFCGDGGPATQACLRNPRDVAVTAKGDVLIADMSNMRIRVVRGAV